MLEGNPHIDRVISFERRRASTWLPARRELLAIRYSFAVDFQGLIKSAVAAKLSGARASSGSRAREVRERPAALLYTDEVSSPSLHRVDRALDLAAGAGAGVLTKDSPIPPGSPEGDLPDSPFVLACPLAGWASKQWPLEYFDQVGDLLYAAPGCAGVQCARLPRVRN